MSPCKGGGQRDGSVGLNHYFRYSLIAEYPMFWISDRPYRCVKKPVGAKCERFVAPNAVVGSPLRFIEVAECWGSYPAREPQLASL